MKGKRGRALLTAAVLLGLCSSVTGLDAERKGVVLGFGLGGAPIVTYTNSDQGRDKSNEAVAVQGLLGYAWNNHNMLVGEIHMAVHDPDDWWDDVANQQVEQGIWAVSWYHYLGKPGRSLFAAVGLGGYSFIYKLNGDGLTDRGPGYLLGGGYEFTKRVQLGAYLIGGHSALGSGSGNGHIQISFVLTAVAY